MKEFFEKGLLDPLELMARQVLAVLPSLLAMSIIFFAGLVVAKKMMDIARRLGNTARTCRAINSRGSRRPFSKNSFIVPSSGLDYSLPSDGRNCDHQLVCGSFQRATRYDLSFSNA